MPDPQSAPFILSAKLKTELNGAYDAKSAVVLAASDRNGQPLLSYRGSIQVFCDDQMGAWIRNTVSSTLDAIAENPRVALIYRSETLPMALLEGRARVATDPAERDRVYDLSPEGERKQDPERKGLAIIIDLNKIDAVYGFDQNGPIREVLVRPSGPAVAAAQ